MSEKSEPREVCPVCRTGFVHTTEAPVSINSVGDTACITTFGTVFFHGPDPVEGDSDE